MGVGWVQYTIRLISISFHGCSVTYDYPCDTETGSAACSCCSIVILTDLNISSQSELLGHNVNFVLDSLWNQLSIRVRLCIFYSDLFVVQSKVDQFKLIKSCFSSITVKKIEEDKASLKDKPSQYAVVSMNFVIFLPLLGFA